MDEIKYNNDNLCHLTTAELQEILPDYFRYNNDIRNTAYLNWRLDFDGDVETQFFDMAQGYFETSMVLIENCIIDNASHKADIWIFPIMFNIVHGIEVYLKGFNSSYRILHKLEMGEYQGSTIEGNHNIQQLCQTAISLVRETSSKELLTELSFVEKFISHLYANTDDMTFARYPITSKKEKQFYVKSRDNVTIDLPVLKQWVIRVYKILDTCTSSIDMQIEYLKDMQDEMRSYFGY